MTLRLCGHKWKPGEQKVVTPSWFGPCKDNEIARCLIFELPLKIRPNYPNFRTTTPMIPCINRSESMHFVFKNRKKKDWYYSQMLSTICYITFHVTQPKAREDNKRKNILRAKITWWRKGSNVSRAFETAITQAVLKSHKKWGKNQKSRREKYFLT